MGGVLGFLIGGYRVLNAPLSGSLWGEILPALLIVPIWALVGLALGSIVHQFLAVGLRKPLTWEEGNLHKVLPVAKSAAPRDPYAVLSLVAILLTLAILGALGAAIGLVYLPVVLQ